METKLALHYTSGHRTRDDLEVFRNWKPKSAKLFKSEWSDINLIRYDPHFNFITHLPNTLLVLRDWELSEQKSDLVRDPVGTGRRHVHDYITNLGRYGYLDIKSRYAITGINEFPFWENMRAYLLYWEAFIDEAINNSFNVVVGNVNTGWPNNTGPGTPVNWKPLEPLYHAIKRATSAGLKAYLALHEYWGTKGPQADWGWLAGRFIQCPWDVEILIGECGLDAYATKEANDNIGYRHYFANNPEAYKDHLRWYDEQLRKYENVHSAQVYTFDFNDHKWSTFDVRDGFKNFFVEHANYVRGLPTPNPKPNPAPTPIFDINERVAQALRKHFNTRFEDLRAILPVHPSKRYATRKEQDINKYGIHHSGHGTSRATTWKQTAEYHINTRNWPGIGYTFGLRKTGDGVKVAYLQNITNVSYHVGDNNWNTVGICVMGNFHDYGADSDEVQTLSELILVLDDVLGKKPGLFGHGELMDNRECPERLQPYVKGLRTYARPVDHRKTVWFLEDAARRARAEGLQAVHDYIVNTILPPVIKLRDGK